MHTHLRWRTRDGKFYCYQFFELTYLGKIYSVGYTSNYIVWRYSIYESYILVGNVNEVNGVSSIGGDIESLKSEYDGRCVGWFSTAYGLNYWRIDTLHLTTQNTHLIFGDIDGNVHRLYNESVSKLKLRYVWRKRRKGTMTFVNVYCE